MTPDRPTWPAQLIDQIEYSYHGLYRGFLHTIDQLDIRKEYIRGKIAVIGQGPAFPERTLLCLPESDLLQTLRPEITFLACCDSEYGSNPHLLLDEDVEVQPEHIEQCSKRVAYYFYGAELAFENIPDNFFDTLFSFQIVDLGKQLRDGLMKTITRVLRPGGVFIGSGGRFGNYLNEIANNEANSMQLVQTVELPNPGYTGYPFDVHTGAIFQKRP